MNREQMIVTYEAGNLIGQRMAYRVSKLLSQRTGGEIPFSWEDSEKEEKWILCDDQALTNGAWRIEVKGKTVVLRAATYYGYTGILKYLACDESEKLYSLPDGYTVSGNYADQPLGAFEGSTKYVYDKKGNQRIMFHNVLWENPRPALRNPLAAEIVRQYRPDVLGCQEFNSSKRFRAAGLDLSLLLSQLGYVEAVDPLVYNADKPENGGFGIRSPKDGKYPYLDAEQIVHEGKVRYSMRNCTPLFYNPSTTRCLTAEYLWYADQCDEENAPGDALDFASKSATWGLFESLADGHRYLVISTHMCTRSNGVKKKQAAEMIALIDRLVAQYDCPVFLGGDYNSTCMQPNYIAFREAGYRDLALDGEAEIEHSLLRTHHTYPVFDETVEMMQPAPDDNTSIGPEARIDQIMLVNGKQTRIHVHGTVVDECSMSASDHYPVFVDVTV